MKQFIVLAAVLPLMLLFVAQYAIDQRNHAATAIAEEEIRAACELARSAGCFTQEIRTQLKSNLAEKLGLSPTDITVTADEGVVYRLNYFDSTGERGLIRYSVSVPIGRVMAVSGLFSTNTPNTRVLTVRGTMASERLP